MCDHAVRMGVRHAIVIASLMATGCIQDFEAPDPERCRLDAPLEVALDEPFAVEVRCPEEPAFIDFDFGDDTDVVRTSALAREHAYDDSSEDHVSWRVQAFVVDQAGEVQRLEAVVQRRF